VDGRLGAEKTRLEAKAKAAGEARAKAAVVSAASSH
jgi:hypothetical protein